MINLDEAIKKLENQIMWCLDNPNASISNEQQIGVLNGLRKAIIILKRMAEEEK